MSTDLSRCMGCGKPFEKEDTYIAFHKNRLVFCPRCIAEAYITMKAWEEDNVEVGHVR